MRANETYSEAKRQFSARNRNVLMNAQCPHKWWSTLKPDVFGMSSSLPPLVGEGGGLVCETVGKADLLSDHFDGKQSRESVDLPLTCDPSPSLSVVFRRLVLLGSFPACWRQANVPLFQMVHRPPLLPTTDRFP